MFFVKNLVKKWLAFDPEAINLSLSGSKVDPYITEQNLAKCLSIRANQIR